MFPLPFWERKHIYWTYSIDIDLNKFNHFFFSLSLVLFLFQQGSLLIGLSAAEHVEEKDFKLTTRKSPLRHSELLLVPVLREQFSKANEPKQVLSTPIPDPMPFPGVRTNKRTPSREDDIFRQMFLNAFKTLVQYALHEDEPEQKSPSNVTHKHTQCEEGHFPENVCSTFTGCSASKYCTESCDKQTGYARCKPNCKTAVNRPGLCVDKSSEHHRTSLTTFNQENHCQIYRQEIQDNMDQN